MNLYIAQGNPLPPSSLIFGTFLQHQSPCGQYWELMYCPEPNIVPNTADRGSDVCQNVPKINDDALYISSLLYAYDTTHNDRTHNDKILKIGKNA